MSKHDPTAESRKADHITLAQASQMIQSDSRFYYEPILSGHPDRSLDCSLEVAGKKMLYPLWISSMTGGTEHAANINKRLATAAQDFGLGMGLGSCRQLLYSDEMLPDFDVRKYMPDQPLFANLGIAQVQILEDENKLNSIKELVNKLNADGLIIHINPLQEWMQPEGDRYHRAPIDSIKKVLDIVDFPIMVKEVGQGMGPKSLETLLDLPVEAVDFGAFGGTNFSKLELLRADEATQQTMSQVANLGHSAEEMVHYVNYIIDSKNPVAKHVIISGGVKGFLDGYYYTQKVRMSSFYAQASAFLAPALAGQDTLNTYVESQIEGLRMAHALLRVK